MSKSMRNDVRTLAYVLRRTNYGEADRILNLITPEGKFSVIAKGVRKEKSKLAGGVEMFSLIDANIHLGKGELGIITSAKMLKYYSAILKDFSKMEFAALVLKKINIAAENSDTNELFKIIDEVFAALDRNENILVIQAWFWFNLSKALGNQINLYRDVLGEKLVENLRYSWDGAEEALRAREGGEIDADSIKIMRLMVATDLSVVLRVRGIEKKISPILRIAEANAKN
ncbi:MAG: DNA repair protein RecO [Candidatus Saccharibacteria bacterium]|nr:DNA repair protein RecO [Candidatus Saccharibacteria bacterium]